MSDGNSLWVWDCMGTEREAVHNQKFEFDSGPSGSQGAFRTEGGQCLDAGSKYSGDSEYIQNGNYVHIQECQDRSNPPPQQAWQMTSDGKIHVDMNDEDHAFNLCLSAATMNVVAGTPVIVVYCSAAIAWDEIRSLSLAQGNPSAVVV